MPVHLDSPAFLAEVHAALAVGPAVQPIEVKGPDGTCRLRILWRELPQKVAAVLVVIAGVLWLMVSPTAPNVAGQVNQLLRDAAVVTQSEQRAPNELPRPRKPKRPTINEDRPVTNNRRDEEGWTGQPVIVL